MKRISNLVLLALGVSVYAMASDGSTASTNPALFFFGGCGMIGLVIGHLAWKIRRAGK